ncbi:MAG: hypothetical protein PUG15_00945 [Bacteroidales bacterium]|nr:hypothetical protein [Bacteroidales bacterium]
MKNFFRLLLCVACAYVMAGCEKEETTARKYGNLIFSSDTITLVPDETSTINYIKSGYWESTTPEPTCMSLDESIVSVDENGNITANNFGETDIVYSVYDTKWKCHIVVTDILQLEEDLINYLKERGFDKNNDNKISLEEAAEVDSIIDFGRVTDEKDPFKFLNNINFFKNIIYVEVYVGFLYDDFLKKTNITIGKLQRCDHLYIYISAWDDIEFYPTLNIVDMPTLKTLFIITHTDKSSWLRLNVENCHALEKVSIGTPVMHSISNLINEPNLKSCSIYYFNDNGEELFYESHVDEE